MTPTQIQALIVFVEALVEYKMDCNNNALIDRMLAEKGLVKAFEGFSGKATRVNKIVDNDYCKQIGSWFKRRETTMWSKKELRAVKDLGKIPPEDMELMTKYYESDSPYKRKDVMTLLNNWNGELDRARQMDIPKSTAPKFSPKELHDREVENSVDQLWACHENKVLTKQDFCDIMLKIKDVYGKQVLDEAMEMIRFKQRGVSRL